MAADDNHPPTELVEYRGGCHCGAVRWQALGPAHIEAERCNCSICFMSGYVELIVPAARFTLLQGSEALHTYTFNTGVAQHHFCRHCGVKSFYVPRSNPDGISLNIHCFDQPPSNITISDFDGVNWEQNAHTLADRSKL